MPKDTVKETLVKIQVYAMVDHLINQCNYSFIDAWFAVLGSKTYHRMLRSNLYLNQGTLYIISDLKRELGIEANSPAEMVEN